MSLIFENYERTFQVDEVKNGLEAIRAKMGGTLSKEDMKLAFSCIDLTTLGAEDTQEKGRLLAEKVSLFPRHFIELPNVAAICVYPTLVKVVRKSLKDHNVALAAVSAGFPSSMTFLEVKKLETAMAVAAGASEIDIVISIGTFLEGNSTEVMKEISQIKSSCGEAHLKVILETGALKTPENIWKASLMAMVAGADFIKTSTGKMEPAATPEAAWVMCSAIREFYRMIGKKVGFKAAGGIVESADAIYYTAIVRSILGEEWLHPHLFRIGASRLANNLLTSITEEKISYF
ncbi:MAG: deoxyribose-phosphate aldolase [Prolixibacteraceae bacterium]|jgi:deoxyribose-phosphate aldolase|nr:deoxyribose-phosphate aldolase [Prolixibacteraceae bacterium]